MKKETFIILGILILISGIFLVYADEVIDNDNDGYNSTIDCNDSDALVWQTITGYLDRDNDIFGDNMPVFFCLLGLPPNYLNIGGDCDDVNPDIYPNATESCNGIDDNCVGGIDENFPDKGQACFVGIGECINPGLIICNKDQNATFCRGTAKKPSTEICDEKDNDCDGLTDEDNICDISNISLGIFSPIQEIYNKNSIQVNLSLISSQKIKASKISYIDYSQSKPREILLCKNCKEHGFFSRRTINLRDGMHNLTFNAYINQTILTNSISIMIDGKRPKMYLPRIRAKDYVNGTFLANYDEINLKGLTLFYENNNIVYNNCTPGNKQICEINVNLTEYSGKNILYRFLITDIAGNFDVSNNMTAEVDITPPVIESISYPVIGNYVFFRLNIIEKNFNDVSYYDHSDDKPRWKILCSVLKNSTCEKGQRLNPGEHNITIRVTDRAKNSVSIFV